MNLLVLAMAPEIKGQDSDGRISCAAAKKEGTNLAQLG